LRTYFALALIIAIAGSLVLPINLALALTDNDRYNSGYNHGCSDGNQGGHYYLSAKGGAANHTPIFMQGYNDGYAKCSGTTNPGTTSQVTQGNWLGTCQTIQNYLVSTCGTYVNSDGSLTVEGERAKGCITNGGILAGGSWLLSNGVLPAGTIVDGLRIAASVTGCDGIVDFVALKQATNLLDILSLFGI
jgi:hypothetical protein